MENKHNTHNAFPLIIIKSIPNSNQLSQLWTLVNESGTYAIMTLFPSHILGNLATKSI